MPQTLAKDGGTPVRSVPMSPWPAPGTTEIEAVAEVVRTGRLNYWTGSAGRDLENEYASRLGRSHAIAVANGTLALELAFRAFGIGPGDEVVVPSRTFIATAGAVVAVGATPVVADIERDGGTMTADTVSAVLTPRTRAVVPVHVAGWPVEMDPILELAREHSLVVVEDCAQAHGARYDGREAGALGSHAATFSFCQDKIIPAGEGGLLVLDDRAAYERAWAYKDHGKSLAKVEADAGAGGTAFRWHVDSFGTNWRMAEACSALALAGLRQLDEWHDARTRNALRLAGGLADLEGLRVPHVDARHEHGFYRLGAYVVPEALAPGWDRDAITAAIAAEGVPVQYGTCAQIYREEAFRAAGLGPTGPMPGAEEVHATALAFYVHPPFRPDEMDDTIAAVRKVMKAACR